MLKLFVVPKSCMLIAQRCFDSSIWEVVLSRGEEGKLQRWVSVNSRTARDRPRLAHSSRRCSRTWCRKMEKWIRLGADQDPLQAASLVLHLAEFHVGP